ncbi:MAG: class I SAM-dependent methyltransferase [Candidatus Bathycorpusculaceae bacterium]
MRNSKRRAFLARMFMDAMVPYERPGEEWSDDEREFLPTFMQILGCNRLVLDLAGGYGRVTPYLLENGNIVVLADLSIHSLKFAKERLKTESLDFVRVDMRHLPFADETFDGVWFTQAFEYVPPDEREKFLHALRDIFKGNELSLSTLQQYQASAHSSPTSKITYTRKW